MTSPPPRFSVAGTFLEGLAAQDVDHLASALHDDVHLRWRVRVIREPGAGWSVVEQQAYADTGGGGDRIEHLALLCSGFRADTGDG